MILINPKSDRNKKLGNFARYVPISIPFSLGFLAGYLLDKGKQVKILDEQVTEITCEILDNYVKNLSKPYIFGMSCLTANISRGYELAEIIKKRYPDCKIIFGGIHPTVLPDEVLKNDYIDIAVRGEGEKTLYLLYNTIKNKKDYYKIPGISFKDKNNKIKHNPPAKLIDLKEIPKFPYNLFDKYSDKYNLGFIFSSRGCPYSCIFCSQRCISGRKYRCSPIERVIEEIDLLINKYGQKHIDFFDDNFLVNKNRTKELCESMYKNGFYNKATFGCQIRADSVDEEMLTYLKKAGFKNLAFGMETASERLMIIINKGETVKAIIKAVKLAKKFGFQVAGTFMFGLPTETKEERYQTYKLAIELDLDYARFNNATPYPGTKLYEIAKSENRLNTGKNWENLNACGSFVEGLFTKSKLAYVPTTTTEKELYKDVLKANLLFWLRPRKIIQILGNGTVSGGWLSLPKRWYLKPGELYYISQLGIRVLASSLKIFFY